ASGMQREGADQVVEQAAQDGNIGQRGRVAAVRFDDPLLSGCAYCCGLPHSGPNFALRGIDFPHPRQELVSGADAGGAGCPSAGGDVGAAGFIAFAICCAMVSPAPSPTPMPAAPPPSLAAAMGIDCATWNWV